MRFTENNENLFLTFKLGNEVYGTPLLGLREIVEYQKPKPIPNTVDHCLGVINIRGEVVGVIDLRARLNHPTELKPTTAMLVFSNELGSICCIVDRVEAVLEISGSNVEKNPNIKSVLPMQYFLGIGNVKNTLITLIDLHKILNSEELTKLGESKLVA